MSLTLLLFVVFDVGNMLMFMLSRVVYFISGFMFMLVFVLRVGVMLRWC